VQPSIEPIVLPTGSPQPVGCWRQNALSRVLDWKAQNSTSPGPLDGESGIRWSPSGCAARRLDPERW
jgi:hypothetical protein